MNKVLFICNHDSSLKMSSFLAKGFSEKGWAPHFFILNERSKQVFNLLEEFEIETNVHFGTIESLIEEVEWDKFKIIHVMALGPTIRSICTEFFLSLEDKPRPRPLFVTGLIGTLGGAVVHCYMHRQMFDLFYTGGEFDNQRLQKVARSLGDDDNKIVATGLPIFDGMMKRDKSTSSKTVLFVGQPTFPKSKEERLWVVKQLVELARIFPDKEIVIKPRVRPNEETIHQATFHFEELLSEVNGPIPSNFSIRYDNIQGLMQDSEIVLTISSTAAFEAIYAGIPVGLITDFGVSEGYGNHIFLGSGAMCSFYDLKNNKWPSINVSWFEKLVRLDLDASGRIVEECLQILEKKKKMLDSGHVNPFLHMKTTFLSKGGESILEIKNNREDVGLLTKIKRNLFSYCIASLKFLRTHRGIDRLVIKFQSVFNRVLKESR